MPKGTEIFAGRIKFGSGGSADNVESGYSSSCHDPGPVPVVPSVPGKSDWQALCPFRPPISKEFRFQMVPARTFMFIQGNQFSQHGRNHICQEAVPWDDCRQTFDGELRLTKPPQPPPPWLFCRRRAPRSGRKNLP